MYANPTNQQPTSHSRLTVVVTLYFSPAVLLHCSHLGPLLGASILIVVAAICPATHCCKHALCGCLLENPVVMVPVIAVLLQRVGNIIVINDGQPFGLYEWLEYFEGRSIVCSNVSIISVERLCEVLAASPRIRKPTMFRFTQLAKNRMEGMGCHHYPIQARFRGLLHEMLDKFENGCYKMPYADRSAFERIKYILQVPMPESHNYVCAFHSRNILCGCAIYVSMTVILTCIASNNIAAWTFTSSQTTIETTIMALT